MLFNYLRQLSGPIGPLQISSRFITFTSILPSRANPCRNFKTPTLLTFQNVSNATEQVMTSTRLGLLKSAPNLSPRELEARRRLLSLRTQQPLIPTPMSASQITLPNKPREISSAEAHNHLWKKFRSKCGRLVSLLHDYTMPLLMFSVPFQVAPPPPAAEYGAH
jgi:hypothetical protein